MSKPHTQLNKEQLEFDDSSKREAIIKNQKDPIMMAMYLAQEFPDMVRCQDNLYKYNGKCYDLVSDKDLDEMFLVFCINWGVTSAWKNISSIIRALLVYPKIKKVDKMNDYEDLICLSNGVLNIKTRDFKPSSPDYYFDSYINIAYDADASACPVFNEYLENTFSHKADTITNIIRLGGYLLDTSCAAEKMFLFDGGGSNGKSVLINTFQLLFSDDQITPLSLDKLASDSFSKELLIKSRVNFCAEQRKGYLDSEELKKIITCDKMEINRKFKVALSFTPKIKIISASNGLPTFKDNSYAIYRRILIIPFNNRYLTEVEYKKVKNPAASHVFIKDKSLFEKIKAERAAILNLFIEGLLDLRANNYEFIESEDSVASMEDYKRDSDSVREFLEDNYEVDETSKIPLSYIYEKFKIWYNLNVSESRLMKFRSAELGKRVKEIMGVESNGREKFYNNVLQKYELLSVYPIKEKIIEPDEPLEETSPAVSELEQRLLDFKP